MTEVPLATTLDAKTIEEEDQFLRENFFVLCSEVYKYRIGMSTYEGTTLAKYVLLLRRNYGVGADAMAKYLISKAA